jgi:hypothetical protein
LTTLLIVNDFTALAMAIPGFGEKDLMQVGQGRPVPQAVIGVLGPGTGLGVSGVIPTEDGFVTLGSEGGHVNFAPADEREFAILQTAWREWQHVSNERLISGPGMEIIHRALAERNGVDAPPRKAADIIACALESQDPLCLEVLECFCGMLGAAAANLAVTLGAFGGIFGILISLGIYFAYDWSALLIKHFPDDIAMVFYVPAAVLIVTAVAVAALVKDTPGEAGLTDFDPGDARDDGPRLGVVAIFKKMLSNPVILTIALIEFCSGFLRQAIMQWYRTFSKQVGLTDNFVYQNWGMLLCCAGIAGGIVAGLISDRVFGSRRGPVAAVLYGGMLAGGILLTFTYDTNALGPIMVVMSMLIIGVHGMLSGTASMDFGGRKNTGVAVGIIDGFVYAGTGTMSVLYGVILPNGEAAKTASNWSVWPISLIPVALVGLLLSVRVWSATARSPAKAGGGH